jgi:hypothetical protein
MNFQTTNQAIRTMFEAYNWDGVQVKYENFDDATPASGLWAKYVFMPGSAEDASIGAPGNNLVRSTGIVMIQVFHDFGEGDGEVYELVDDLINHVRSTDVPNVTFRAPYPNRVGRNGKWWQINVVCPWFADYRS